MKNNLKNIMACVAIVAISATASFAGNPQDIVTGAGKQPIRGTKFGNCVQTKWSSSTDVCATVAPAPQAEVAPTPAPVPAPQPVTQLGREQLVINFDFNKSIVTKESTVKLDQIADAVNRSPKVTKVNIVGYTDEIGTDKYNNKLSVKRAHAVKEYLDTKMRIDANVLGLRGLGKQDPLVECKKTKNRTKKIACLAKNRRVEIEFEFEK